MKKILNLCAVVFLSVGLLGCAESTTNLAAATVETSAQTVIMTPALAYMTLPRCTAEITKHCGTKETATKINDAQLSVEACLKTYRAALVAYKKSQTDTNAAAVSSAINAVDTAKASLASILSLPSVQSALEN